MLDKFNQLCEEILADKKKTVKRKAVRVKNIPVKKNVNQFCEGEKKELKTPLTQEKNVK